VSVVNSQRQHGHLAVPIVNVKKALVTARSKIAAITAETALKLVENRIGFVAVMI
jgi:hypothetical protein